MSTVFVSFLKRDRGLPDFKRAHKNYFSWAFLFFWPLLTLFAGAIMDATVTLVNKKKHFLFVKKFKLDWNIMLINHYSFTSGISFGRNIFIGVFFYIDISKKIVIQWFTSDWIFNHIWPHMTTSDHKWPHLVTSDQVWPSFFCFFFFNFFINKIIILIFLQIWHWVFKKKFCVLFFTEKGCLLFNKKMFNGFWIKFFI
jgi:hypothetical protein